MIIDGRAIADEILAGVKSRRRLIAKPITLGIVVFPGDVVIESFVGIKSKIARDVGIAMIRKDMDEPTTAAAMDAVRSFKYDASVDGIIVQLPLPAGVDINAVLSEVPMEKDIDGINPFTRNNERLVRAPVALAVQEILQRSHVHVSGMRAVVVGAGRLVGLPSAALLRELGADVSMLTLTDGSTKDLKTADIVVSGAGKPHFILPQHLKEGVVLIDAGTSETRGVIQGDVHPSCKDIARVFTPVPGGVGPIAVALIFQNLLDLAKQD